MTDDWCSVCNCPFNPDKLPRQHPILSSSFSSAITGSLSSSTQSSSSDEERKSSPLYRSSLGHPNDYYTSKRIDQLHDRMDDIQILSFLKFVNYHLSLKKSKYQINDIGKDLANGHVLIDLIEIFSTTKLKREQGQTRFHSLTNVRHVLDYLQKHTEHLNISPQDIVSGNRKQILALLWIIMKLFDFPSFRLTNKNCFRENTLLGCGQDRSVILQWLNQILNQTLPKESTPIQDFYLQTWINGYYFSRILKYLVPLSTKYITVQTFEYLKELDQLEPYNQQSFHLCLNLCNHCFNTVTTIDYGDRTERSLFKYFTELQQNVLILLKSNQIGKLIQNNPYTKQILETVGQTVHVSNVIENNEQYLICMENNPVTAQNKLPNESSAHAPISEDLRTSLVQRREQCETLSRVSHPTNGHSEVSELVTIKAQQPNRTAKPSVKETTSTSNDGLTSPQPHEKVKGQEPQLSVTPNNTGQDSEQLRTTANGETKQSADGDTENYTNNEGETFVPTNHENEQVTLDQSIVIAQEPEQVAPIVSQSTTSNDDAVVPTTDHLPNKLSEVQKAQEQQLSTSSEESTVEKAKDEQPSNTERESLPVMNEEPQLTSIEKQEDHKSTCEYETLQQSIVLTQENEVPSTNSDQSTKERIEQPKTKIKPSVQIGSTTSENEHIPEKSQSISTKTDCEHQVINSTKVNSTSSINDEQLVQTIQSNHYDHNNEKLKLHPSLKSAGLNQERTIVPVENKHLIVANEERKQSTADQTPPSLVSHEEHKQNVTEPMENEILATTAKKPEPSSVQQDQSNKTENKPSSYLVTDTTTAVNNHSLATNAELKQSATEKTLQSSISSGKTITVSTENNAPITKSKKGQRSVIPRETPQSTIATNIHLPSSTTKSPGIVKPSIEEKRYLEVATDRLQPTSEPSVHAASATTKGNKYSDVVTKQATKVNKGPTQAVSSLKAAEQCAASKKNGTSTLNEESKQSFTSIEEAVPRASEKSKVILEKEGQPVVSVKNEASVSTLSNEDIKQPSNRSKKSRRANAKKGKATNSSTKIDCSDQAIPEHEEQLVEVPSDSTNVVEEEKSTPTQSEILVSSSNSHTPLKNENSPKSNALRSRKNKKKKTVATTTTTLIEKPSPSRSTINTTPNRNLLVVLKQFIADPKSTAFKCIFILLCLCFSIIILVLSHK